MNTAAPAWLTLPEPLHLPHPDGSGSVESDGASLHYATWNRDGADPVILLHGGLGSMEEWASQVPALLPRHQVVAIDSRGHGRSTGAGQPFGYRLMAADVVAVMDFLGLDRASIAGFSDGAIIGLELAMNRPDRVGRLFAFGANFNASGLYPGVEDHPVQKLATAQAAARFRRISPAPDAWNALMRAVVGMWHREPDYSPGQLGRITAPCLIVDGEHEEAIRPEHSDALAALIPGARRLTIPAVSHFAMVQDPAAFNAALTAFLDGPRAIADEAARIRAMAPAPHLDSAALIREDRDSGAYRR